MSDKQLQQALLKNAPASAAIHTSPGPYPGMVSERATVGFFLPCKLDEQTIKRITQNITQHARAKGLEVGSVFGSMNDLGKSMDGIDVLEFYVPLQPDQNKQEALSRLITHLSEETGGTIRMLPAYPTADQVHEAMRAQVNSNREECQLLSDISAPLSVAAGSEKKSPQRG